MNAIHEEGDHPLEVTIHRSADALVWRVENVSPAPVWAFLLVPTLIDGAYSFAVDSAWLEVEGDRLLVRKVDAPVPDGRKVERLSTGAVELPPGGARQGRILLGDEVTVGGAYARERSRHRVRTVVMEVGWLPVHAAQEARRYVWDGQPFAYLRSELEPRGQRFERSAPLAWEP